MINSSACYSISNQSPSNDGSYESLVAQRRILTASKSFSDGLNLRETPLPTKGVGVGGGVGGENGGRRSSQPPDGDCPLQPPDPYQGSTDGKVSSSPVAGQA